MTAHRFAVLLLALCLAGCGRPKGTPDTQNPAAAAQTQIEATLAELTQTVRKYAMEQQKAPKDLQELVDKGYLKQVPQPPAAKKFVLTKKLEVQLADQ
jgi:competence protein ComGC